MYPVSLDHHSQLQICYPGRPEPGRAHPKRFAPPVPSPRLSSASIRPGLPSFAMPVTCITMTSRSGLARLLSFFLAFIDDRWFNGPHPIMEPDQGRSLCVDWACAVDGIEHTYEVQKATILFASVKSQSAPPASKRFGVIPPGRFFTNALSSKCLVRGSRPMCSPKALCSVPLNKIVLVPSTSVDHSVYIPGVHRTSEKKSTRSQFYELRQAWK